MKAAIFLRWLERTLLAVGVGLGIWCGAVLLEAHFVGEAAGPRSADCRGIGSDDEYHAGPYGSFRAVRDLRTSDPLELMTRDRIYRYLITKTFIVEPEDVYVLDPGDRPMLTLVTCYPFTFIGHAPHRYIIQAVLVDQVARGMPDAPHGAGKAGRAVTVPAVPALPAHPASVPRGILIMTTQ